MSEPATPQRTLVPSGGNDRVYTPDDLAATIVRHFKPEGFVLEPCSGKGAFVRAIRTYLDSTGHINYLCECEIDDGQDFFKMEADHRFNYIMTNPPWSMLLPFLQRSMYWADNVIFLCLVPAFFQKAKQRAILEAGFGIKEILYVQQPKKPWPSTGFCLGAVHIQRGWKGPITQSHA